MHTLLIGRCIEEHELRHGRQLNPCRLVLSALAECDEVTRRVVQVVADIATAIDQSAAAGVAHRDITPNNFGHLDKRGILYDYSAGKVSAGHCIVVCWG